MRRFLMTLLGVGVAALNHFPMPAMAAADLFTVPSFVLAERTLTLVPGSLREGSERAPHATPATRSLFISFSAAPDGEEGADEPSINTTEEFYRANASPVFWIAQERSADVADLRRDDLLAALRDASGHGLPNQTNYAAALEARLEAVFAAGPAMDLPAEQELEQEMMATFLKLAGALRSGLLSPGDFTDNFVIPETIDLAALFGRLAAGDRVRDIIAAQAPQDPAYASLRAAYADLLEEAETKGAQQESAPGNSLKLGMKEDAVLTLRSRLREFDQLETDPEEPARFDEELVARVMAFQRRHGLETDGVVGPATLAELNVSSRERLGQLAVALERMRWRSRSPGRLHVWVNQADFTMQLLNEGQVVFETKAIVGSPKHPTPEFTEVMDHMVVNPSWSVPTSIAENEIKPKVRKNPAYLEQNDMYRREDGRIVQRPGPDNALGTVKFMFPNRHAIYLHDTPSRHLFAEAMRALSHGCIRLEDPHGFALALLGRQSDDPERIFSSALESGRQSTIQLEDPIPVHLTYQTAWIDSSGVLQFRPDVYGRDSAILEALVSAGLRLAPESAEIAALPG